MEDLGVDSFDPESIRLKLALYPSPKHKQVLSKRLKRITQIAKLEHTLQHELEQITQKQKEMRDHATIDILKEVFAGTEFSIGEKKIQIKDDIARISVRLFREEEESEIHMTPLRSIKF